MIPIFIIFGIVLIFILILLIRTLAFKPQRTELREISEVSVDRDRITHSLA